MKKLTFLSLFLMLAMLLAACEPAETEPGLDGTPGGLGEPGETLVVPGETPVEPMDATPTVVIPDETPLATEETPVAPGDTTGAVEDPADSPNRASNLLDVEVRNYEEETIGDVEEMILSLNGESEQVSYVVVGVGGFLGIGERSVAVPYEALELVRNSDDPSDYAFYMEATQDQVESLPEINYDELDFTLPDWDVDISANWQDGVIVTDEEAQAGDETMAEDDAEDTDTEDDDAAMGDSEAVAQGDNFRDVHAIRVSGLMGSTVYSDTVADMGAEPADPAQPAEPGDQGTPATPAEPADPADPDAADDPRNAEVLGHVEDLIVDYTNGMVEYAIVEADNALDVTDPWIPVPLQALNIMVEGDGETFVGITTDYLVQVDRQQLVQAPGFEVGVLPIVEDPDWDTGVRDYWVVE